MKKLLSLIVCFVLVFSLVGCNSFFNLRFEITRTDFVSKIKELTSSNCDVKEIPTADGDIFGYTFYDKLQPDKPEIVLKMLIRDRETDFVYRITLGTDNEELNNDTFALVAYGVATILGYEDGADAFADKYKTYSTESVAPIKEKEDNFYCHRMTINDRQYITFSAVKIKD